MKQFRIIHSIVSMFKPPFRGLTTCVWAYFVLCYIFFPHSSILYGDLPDTDDYTYLNQTLDWLQGQGWFDNVQYRLSPPEGVRIHFTRIVQLPLALIIMFFKTLGFPWRGAATLAAILWPPIVFMGFLSAVRWSSKSFLPRDWTRITAYITLFTGSLLFQFVMGHVDHHGLESIIIILSFGSIVRMMVAPYEIKWALLAGFLLSLSLSIALEVLPWVIALSSFAGLWLVIKGRVAARSGIVFGLALYLSSILFLVAYRAPEQWFEADVLAYSVVYVILTASMAICFVGVALATQTGFAWLRYFSGVGLCGAMAALFFSHFPELLAGPYGAADKEIVRLFFKNISEAMPLVQSNALIAVMVRLLVPLMALGTSLAILYKSKDNDSWPWFFISLLIGVGIISGTFYQVRMINYAYLFGIIPMSVLLHRGWKYVGEHYRGRRQFLMELFLILLVGPLPMVLVPGMFDGRSLNVGVGMFPVQQARNVCKMMTLELVLRSPKFYGEKPLTIMNTIDTGPELIFRSSHKVMAAPYHTNVRGNKESLAFFSTSDPAEAEAVARRNNIDLVVICRLVPNLYFGEKGANQVTVNSEGKVDMNPGASFVESMIYGKQPAWLKKADIPFLKEFLVFEVVRDEDKDKEPNPTPAL